MYVVFECLLGLEIEKHQNLDVFQELENPKINYSILNIKNSFHIWPIGILSEKVINTERPEYIRNQQQKPLLFPTHQGDIEFDPLAAAFYIVSRYEEYANPVKDEHDRYPASESILTKLDCLLLPIVHIWADILKKKLKNKYPSLEFSEPSYSYTPTFDIDMAWSYKAKGWLRNLGAHLKDMTKLELGSNAERLKVNVGLQKDPFDQYDYIVSQTKAKKLNPIFFFLMGKYSDYDKNIDPEDANFKKLIKEIASSFQTGIHPSYYHKTHLIEEIKHLEKATGKAVKISRQHYIKLTFPETYKLLLSNQIEADYSMGYPDQLGFRNGLCIPTLWYNLESEAITNLMVHPFQLMDVTLKNYLEYSPGEAIEAIKNMVDTIAQFGGTFISIWHNSSFDKDWNGWQKVFEEMLSYASSKS